MASKLRSFVLTVTSLQLRGYPDQWQPFSNITYLVYPFKLTAFFPRAISAYDAEHALAVTIGVGSVEMNEHLRQSLQDIVKEHGPWTAHNVKLGDGVWTIGENSWYWPEMRAHLAAYLTETVTKKKIAEMRCLDIGCLEGGFSLTLGLLGAEVVGLDIRPENLVKANFARDALGLENVRFVEGDMHKLEEYKLGQFDLVIASGVLYHVDAPRLLSLLSTLRKLSAGLVVVDTHVATAISGTHSENSRTYHGRTFVEFGDTLPRTAWSSMENSQSFWLTERSLVNALVDSGFSFVFKPMAPTVEYPWKDRIFLCALAEPESVSTFAAQLPRSLPEPDSRQPYHPMLDHPSQIEAVGHIQSWETKYYPTMEPALLPPADLMATEFFPVLDGWFAWGEEWKFLIRAFGNLDADGSVFEMECGLGRCAFALRKFLRNGTYVGEDTSLQKIEFLQKHFSPAYPNFRFDVGGENVTNTFDLVFAPSIFTRVLPARAQGMFASARRALKPNGRFMAGFLFADDYQLARARSSEFIGGTFDFRYRVVEGGFSCLVNTRDRTQPTTAAYPFELIATFAKENGFRVISTFPGAWSGRHSKATATLDVAIFVPED